MNVEFDDGDSGRIPLNHIRLLPPDFPLVSEYPHRPVCVHAVWRLAALSVFMLCQFVTAQFLTALSVFVLCQLTALSS